MKQKIVDLLTEYDKILISYDQKNREIRNFLLDNFNCLIIDDKEFDLATIRSIKIQSLLNIKDFDFILIDYNNLLLKHFNESDIILNHLLSSIKGYKIITLSMLFTFGKSNDIPTLGLRNSKIIDDHDFYLKLTDYNTEPLGSRISFSDFKNSPK